ncbi:hypothetical protein DUNSADRAFT_11092 [Dunaliella salina]|uniref:Uncharacterized protein n=1 Tax=Dunaliella salina TaxID=3046 RepID=A0ABQ7H4I7_DUNSA|nr:hypothetical protein DUNSADRAFT_11092 [Dunaliella salina]|eukprot:KAF5841776.1 hypothetical protein DUNSADRAFT_11092 [Dunaliella salina]
MEDDDIEDPSLLEQVKEYDLKQNHELRMECKPGRDVRIMLEEGSAEVFGAELQKGNAVDVSGQKLAVYTWTGCKLKVQGLPAMIYEAEDTPVAVYCNLHQMLRQSRQDARQQQQQDQQAGGAPSTQEEGGQRRPPFQIRGHGPRVIIVGPTDSGKSTLTKTLLNWGVRDSWEPTFVDLDVDLANPSSTSSIGKGAQNGP